MSGVSGESIEPAIDRLQVRGRVLGCRRSLGTFRQKTSRRSPSRSWLGVERSFVGGLSVRLANRLFLHGRLRESARMLSFLGELIGLMVWLFQQGSEVLRRMVGPAERAERIIWRRPALGLGFKLLGHAFAPNSKCHSVRPVQDGGILFPLVVGVCFRNFAPGYCRRGPATRRPTFVLIRSTHCKEFFP